MDLNRLSPYIRVAMYSTMGPRHHLGRRTIFDYEIICVKGGGSDIMNEENLHNRVHNLYVNERYACSCAYDGEKL